MDENTRFIFWEKNVRSLPDANEHHCWWAQTPCMKSLTTSIPWFRVLYSLFRGSVKSDPNRKGASIERDK